MVSAYKITYGDDLKKLLYFNKKARLFMRDTAIDNHRVVATHTNKYTGTTARRWRVRKVDHLEYEITNNGVTKSGHNLASILNDKGYFLDGTATRTIGRTKSGRPIAGVTNAKLRGSGKGFIDYMVSKANDEILQFTKGLLK